MPQVIYRQALFPITLSSFLSSFYLILFDITCILRRKLDHYHILCCLRFDYRYLYFYSQFFSLLVFCVVCQWLTWVYISSANQIFCIFPLFLKDTTICTGCCSILDNIVSHIFKQLSIKGNIFTLYLLKIYKFFGIFWFWFAIVFIQQHSRPKSYGEMSLIQTMICSWRWLKCIRKFCKAFSLRSLISSCLKIAKINGHCQDRCSDWFCCMKTISGLFNYSTFPNLFLCWNLTHLFPNLPFADLWKKI